MGRLSALSAGLCLTLAVIGAAGTGPAAATPPAGATASAASPLVSVLDSTPWICTLFPTFAWCPR